MGQKFFNQRNEILQNISRASLEEITQILNHYKSSQILDNGTVNMQPILVNGVTYHSKYNPQEVASLNARYRELTGQDHPVFLEEQAKVLDLLLSNKDELLKQGYLPMQIDTLERLRMNLHQEVQAIDNLNPGHPFIRKSDIILNLSKTSLEEITQILNHYKSSQILDNGTVNMQPILVNGVTYHSKYNPQEAASLNAKYRELTGQDHPVFLEEQAKVLDLLLSNKDELLKQGYLPMQIDTLERLKANLTQGTPAIEVTTGIENHILNRFDDVLGNLQKVSLEDISLLLNYYNGEPVVINGISYHPFNDPMLAAKLNVRYHELTGQDHPIFVEQAPMVIDRLMQDKDILLQAGAYSPEYFETLEQIKNTLGVEVENLPKHR